MTNSLLNATGPDRIGAIERASPTGTIDGASAQRPTGRSRFAAPAVIALLGPMLVIALSVMRSPAIMAHGRFWAEESHFLAHMLATKSLLYQVFYVYRGHIELLNSTVFALASHLDLKVIPLATTYCGLLIECVLAFMVVFFRKDLEMRLAPALLICVLIVVSPIAVEHYLNMLNSVWITSAILLLIINLPPERLANHRVIVVSSTFVLGLSGIPATCLMPLALLHALVWRSRPHLLVAATLTLCCFIQGALVLIHGAEDRFSSVSPWVYLAAPFLHINVEHLFGVDAASALGHWFKDSGMDAALLPPLMLVPLAILAWMAMHIVRRGETRSRLLLVAIVYTAAFNITFALGDRNDLFTVYAMRYFFLPSFALALLLARTDKVSSQWPPGFALGLMAFVTVISSGDFFRNPFHGTYVDERHHWRRDVEACEARATACTINIGPGDVPVGIPDEALNRRIR